MRCPICKKEVAITDPEMPFCSERCRLVDLGNWASGKYFISTPLRDADAESLEDPEQSERDEQEGPKA